MITAALLAAGTAPAFAGQWYTFNIVQRACVSVLGTPAYAAMRFSGGIRDNTDGSVEVYDMTLNDGSRKNITFFRSWQQCNRLMANDPRLNDQYN